MNFGNLNEQQFNAITDTLFKNTVLVAGAGSGKTTVLTDRIAFLINDCDVEPHNIMALTFTKKAANEMTERVNKKVKSTEGLWIGTFHRICTKLLKKFGFHIGLSNKFTTIDPEDTRKMIKTILNEIGADSSADEVKVYISAISSYKSNCISPRLAYDNSETDRDKLVAIVYSKYRKKCKEKNMLDYDDLISYGIELFKSKAVKNWFKENIQYILVDEYQDVNKAQYVLVKSMLDDENNLFVVGDPKQSIYGFRNSDPSFIENFEDMFNNTRVMYLDKNYRSTKTIVEASNSLIKNNKSKFEVNCTANKGEGSKIIEHEATNVFEEAIYISNKIKEFIDKGYKYSDIAILYRTNSQSAFIENQLIKDQIPYTIYKGLTFFKRAEVKDMLAFLKFVSNTYDETSFNRALSVIKGIGPKTVKAVIDYSDLISSNYYNGLIAYIDEKMKVSKKETSTVKNLKKALDIFTQIGNASSNKTPAELISLTYELTEYKKSLTKNFDTKSDEIKVSILEKIENINELIIMSEEIYKSNKNESLEDFLDEIALLTQETEKEENNVRLMTIHSAKGLEFMNVFICGVEDDILPSYLSKGCQEDFEEERRLMYVAMTRAEENLFMTYCKYRKKGDMSFKTEKSNFIYEIDSEYIEYDYTTYLEEDEQMQGNPC